MSNSLNITNYPTLREAFTQFYAEEPSQRPDILFVDPVNSQAAEITAMNEMHPYEVHDNNDAFPPIPLTRMVECIHEHIVYSGISMAEVQTIQSIPRMLFVRRYLQYEQRLISMHRGEGIPQYPPTYYILRAVLKRLDDTRRDSDEMEPTIHKMYISHKGAIKIFKPLIPNSPLLVNDLQEWQRKRHYYALGAPILIPLLLIEAIGRICLSTIISFGLSLYQLYDEDEASYLELRNRINTYLPLNILGLMIHDLIDRCLP